MRLYRRTWPDGWKKYKMQHKGYYYINKDMGLKQSMHPYPLDGFMGPRGFISPTTQQKANKHLQKIFWFSFLEYGRINS